MKPYRFTTVPTSLWWLRGNWVAIWWCGVGEFDGTTPPEEQDAAVDDVMRHFGGTRQAAEAIIDGMLAKESPHKRGHFVLTDGRVAVSQEMTRR